MTIGGIGGNTKAGAVGMGNPNMDSYAKNLQRQIADAKKSLQELSQNDEMDPDTKMKKRQEIQKQINNLNMQLRQHQMEERGKALQETQQKMRHGKSEDHAAGLSKNSMEAMISGDNSLKLAKVQGSTANQMQNGADIKRSEIRLDGGGSTRSSDDNAAISSKWDDVESMEQRAKAATASQISLLAEAQNKLQEANAEECTSAKTQEKSGEKSKTKIENHETAAAEAAGAAKSISAAAAISVQEETRPVCDNPAKQSAAIGSRVDVKV